MRCIANTGPLISAFQSESESLLGDFSERIYVPSGALPEYERHGARPLLRALESRGLVEVVSLDPVESETAVVLARRLAGQSPNRPDPTDHMGEAEALALFTAGRIRADLLLVDELPARALAMELDVPVAGFPGVLVRLAARGRISAVEVRARLEVCRSLGTHYSQALIDEAHRLAAKRSEEEG
ncbi:MAG: hypothetical protein HY720_30430 [Planctomycetes bacterium]|nr:hypothetical protein [Planctomycetota bacterium]